MYLMLPAEVNHWFEECKKLKKENKSLKSSIRTLTSEIARLKELDNEGKTVLKCTFKGG